MALSNGQRWGVRNFNDVVEGNLVDKTALVDVAKRFVAPEKMGTLIDAVNKQWRGHPVRLLYATSIAKALTELTNADAPKIGLEGAFFLLPYYKELLVRIRMGSEQLVAHTGTPSRRRLPIGLIDDVIDGQRTTLATALVMVRAVNVVLAHEQKWVDATEHILTDAHLGKKATAKESIFEATDYDVWMPAEGKPEHLAAEDSKPPTYTELTLEELVGQAKAAE
jgi:hypothetical protein